MAQKGVPSFFSRFTDLDECGVRHNTNKSSEWVHPDGKRETKEGLLVKYEFFLRELKFKDPLRMIELGAGPENNIGASVRAWRDYFGPGAAVHVADINPAANGLEKEGFHVHIGDLGHLHFLDKLAQGRWDFVIDDASHFWWHQVLAFRKLFPSINSGGIFICEDLCTSFAAMRKQFSFELDMKDAASYFLALSRGALAPYAVSDDPVVREIYKLSQLDIALIQDIHMISITHNSCIIVKR